MDDLKILNDVRKLNINIITFHDGFQRSKIWGFLEQYLAIIYLRNMVKKIGDTILLSVESLCSSQPRISNDGKCTVNRIHDETTNRFINMQK